MVEPELFGHSQRSLWQTFLLWPSLTEGCLLGAHFMRDPRSDAGNCSHGWLVVSSGNKLQVTARSIPPRENWMLQEPTSEFETPATGELWLPPTSLVIGYLWVHDDPPGTQQKPAQQSKCSCANRCWSLRTGCFLCTPDLWHIPYQSTVKVDWAWLGTVLSKGSHHGTPKASYHRFK